MVKYHTPLKNQKKNNNFVKEMYQDGGATRHGPFEFEHFNDWIPFFSSFLIFADLILKINFKINNNSRYGIFSFKGM